MHRERLIRSPETGFIPIRVTLKISDTVFAVSLAEVRRACVLFVLMSTNSVPSFMIDTCNATSFKNGLHSVCTKYNRMNQT